jgi:hypothetical protein
MVNYSIYTFIYNPQNIYCRNPLLGKCEDETCTPKSGNLKSSETHEILEFNCKGQKKFPWGVVYTFGKVLKCRCRKWPRMSHSDICSTSYGQKKGRELTWPRCMQVECNTLLESSWWVLQICFRPHPNQRSELGVMSSQSPENPNWDSFGTSPWESRD